MSKTPLRFRYTTYLGENHPAAKKVVCEFTTTDLAAAASLSPVQRVKLQKLLGVRYNPATDLARLSSENFAEPAQNKRYLGDLINSLVTASRDATDMFDDIPIDDRHLRTDKKKNKKKAAMRPKFPESWSIDPNAESVKRITEHREVLRLSAAPEKETGRRRPIVDGRAVVHDYVRAREAVAIPVPMSAPR